MNKKTKLTFIGTVAAFVYASISAGVGFGLFLVGCIFSKYVGLLAGGLVLFLLSIPVGVLGYEAAYRIYKNNNTDVNKFLKALCVLTVFIGNFITFGYLIAAFCDKGGEDAVAADNAAAKPAEQPEVSEKKENSVAGAAQVVPAACENKSGVAKLKEDLKSGAIDKETYCKKLKELTKTIAEVAETLQK